jgi:hypothetical protein
MVTILPASFSTTSYSWHYKDDNQSLWKVKETQSEIIPSTNEDTGKKPVWKPSSEDRAASLSTCVQKKAAF